jgi:hypothetical protein
MEDTSVMMDSSIEHCVGADEHKLIIKPNCKPLSPINFKQLRKP